MVLKPEFVAKQKEILEVKLSRYLNLDRKLLPDFYIKAKKQAAGHIVKALQAIEDGTYGNCQKCRRQIDLNRLVAVPGAIHCIQCASQEQKEG
mgnify:CR=1 FL=1